MATTERTMLRALTLAVLDAADASDGSEHAPLLDALFCANRGLPVDDNRFHPCPACGCLVSNLDDSTHGRQRRYCEVACQRAVEHRLTGYVRADTPYRCEHRSARVLKQDYLMRKRRELNVPRMSYVGRRAA